MKEQFHFASNDTTFTIHGDSKVTFESGKGTQIIVPEKCFVFEDGKPVNGDIELKFEEFHSAQEILMSGITMHYEESGENYEFESAGMFQISGKCGNKDVRIANGKAVQVELASNQSADDYNLYKINKSTGKWEKISTPVVKENPITQLAEKVKPGKFLNLNIDYNIYPQLKSIEGAIWRIKNEKDNVRFEKYENRGFELVQTKGTNGDLFEIRCNTGEERIAIAVEPDVSENELNEITNSIASANRALQRAQRNNLSLSNQNAQFVRSLQLNDFGVYNCDRPIIYASKVSIDATFIADNNRDVTDSVSFYLLSGNNTAIYQYSPVFKVDAERENRVVCFHKNGRVFIGDKSQFNFSNSERVNELSKKKIILKELALKPEKEEDWTEILKYI
ncbi:MAG: hypothetical protein R2850_05985 [Bacteroidia bacterium]